MTWSISVIKAVIALINSWFNFHPLIKGKLLFLLLKHSTIFNASSVLLMTAPTVILSATPPIAIGFEVYNPFIRRLSLMLKTRIKQILRFAGLWVFGLLSLATTGSVIKSVL